MARQKGAGHDGPPLMSNVGPQRGEFCSPRKEESCHGPHRFGRGQACRQVSLAREGFRIGFGCTPGCPSFAGSEQSVRTSGQQGMLLRAAPWQSTLGCPSCVGQRESALSLEEKANAPVPSRSGMERVALFKCIRSGTTVSAWSQGRSSSSVGIVSVKPMQSIPHPNAPWPNPSIERTCLKPLRAFSPAAHVKR